ncbi:MAG TPA: EAL domain-containing protein [Rhodocyclaceae bacterium]|nr:EAL domain-containing protein [Rhodocyclaceae bacterium]
MVIPSEAPFSAQVFESPADADGAAHILIVDDDATLRRTLVHALAGSARHFGECGSAGEAMELLGSCAYDLILLDYRLPDATGLAVLDWLADHRRDESVIMISGEDSVDAAIGALRRGADDFVRKPYHVAQLQRTVQSALHKRSLERVNRAMSERLRVSERLHRYLVESSPDLIFTLDGDSRFSYLNPRIEDLLGHPRNQLLKEPFSSLVMAEDRERIDSLLRAQKSRPGSSFSIELRLQRPPGSGAPRHITVALQGMPMIGRDGGTTRYIGLYGVARDISERKRAEEIISFQAYHDQLTRLPNRVLFKDRLDLAIAQAQRRNGTLAVMFIDVDRFKLVNDTFGHAEGDALLRGVAGRLSATLRRGDTLARLGGDEFTILLPDIETPNDAEVIARKILGAFARPFPLHHGEFRATASVGIAIFPQDGTSAETLTQHADIAMYQVKRSGKNGFRFFAPELNTHHQGRIALENALRVALERNEFELYYQPQVSLSEQRVIGVEALLRWNHPDNGVMSPADFIPIAEEVGLIGDISRWVIERACAQLASWRSAGFTALKMSLNLAPHDFDREDILELVSACIGRHGLPPARLELEITETMMMRDTASVATRVRQLREAGVGVAIDDFGTGYSALAYLQQLPVRVLKIDRSFVRDLDGMMANPIVSAITGIAKGFGLKLIAEGVEYAQQAITLRALGCDVMQGYYFGRPERAEDVVALLGKPPRALVT